MIRPLTAACALALAAGCMAPTSSGPTTAAGLDLLNPVTVTRFADVDLAPAANRAYRAFIAEDQAYGAMYVTTDGTGWYWRAGSFSAEDVRRETELACEGINESACLLYATVTPTTQDGDVAFPSRIAEDLERAVAGTQDGDYIAFAVMPVGAYGYGFNARTAEDAMALAMGECERREASERDEFGQTVEAKLDANGMFTCRPFQVIRR